MLPRDFNQRIHIRNFHGRVRDGFEINKSCVFLNRHLHTFNVGSINKRGSDTKVGQSMIKHLVSRAVGRPVTNNMVTAL